MCIRDRTRSCWISTAPRSRTSVKRSGTLGATAGTWSRWPPRTQRPRWRRLSMINPRLVKSWSFESQFEGGGESVFLVDNTLRDGDQTAGVVFATTEKVRIARLLSEIGVHEMETGSPWLCPEERDAMAEICSLGLATKCLGFCRADPQDIAWAKECGVDGVVISSSTSRIHIEKKYGQSKQWVLD